MTVAGAKALVGRLGRELAEQATIKRKVEAKFPSIDAGGKKKRGR